MEKFIITGGAGFVGRGLARRLSINNHVISVDLANNEGEQNNIESVSLDITGDLSSIPKTRNAIIIHTAALMQAENLDTFWKVNVDGTKKIIEWAMKNDAVHFVFLSTGGVYGYSKNRAMKEDDPVEPIGMYGYTKWIGENIAMMFSKEFGLPVTIIRLYFPYGTGQKSGIFPLILKSIRDGRALTINKNGAPLIKPVHIDDLIVAIRMISEKPSGFNVYNICGDDIVSFLEIVRLIEKESGRQASLVFSEKFQGDLLADNSKIKRDLGWSPKKDIISGTREFIRLSHII